MNISIGGSRCVEHYWLLDHWIKGESIVYICRDCGVKRHDD